MPKSVLLINKFEGGLVNQYDPRDLPENALSDANGVMVDVQGKIRNMGGSKTHAIINSGGEIEGFFSPGYGLFAFNADHNISNEAKETKLLAIQNGTGITIYDGSMHTDEIRISTAADVSNIRPVFYYVDGRLRVSDLSLSNVKSVYPRRYQFIDKTWFYGVSSFPNATAGLGYVVPADWYDLDSYIFPPSASGADNNNGQLVNRDDFAAEDTAHGNTAAYGKLGTGSIFLHADYDSTAGEWEQDSSLQFGASFVYDDDQESPITQFLKANGTACVLDTTSGGGAADGSIKLQVGVGFDDASEDASSIPFDPRLKGVNIYWMGDSLGVFDDPLFMAYMHFGTSDDDKPYFESHAGDKQTAFTADDVIGGQNNAVKNTNALVIPKLPALTYELRTGITHGEESTAARYASAVVVNRRTYIGGVKRVKFLTDSNVTDDGDFYTTGNCKKQCRTRAIDTEHDRMLVSPVNAFDIFPKSNFIDVAINDGEKITALVSFSDRLLQFKNENLYIINISEDYERLESEHRFMGVNHDYQVCTTEFGPVWVNKNGCYLYDGEKINNLILGKLNPTESSTAISLGWSEFIGSNGMVGYIQELKQIVIMQDPASAILSDDLYENTGDVMIYDIMTQSWTRGEGRVSGLPKSNIVANYDNTCMFLSHSTNNSEVILSDNIVPAYAGVNAHWTITNTNQNMNASNTYLTINGVNITNTFSYSATAENDRTFREELAFQIQSYINATDFINTYGSGSFLVDQGNPDDFTLVRPSWEIESSDTFNGNNIVFTNTPSGATIVVAKGEITKDTVAASHFENALVYEVSPPELPDNVADTYALHLASTSEVTGSDYSNYPQMVLFYHCHLDLYNVFAPIGSAINSVSSGLYGIEPQQYHSNGDTIFINPNAIQIKVTKAAGGNFAGLPGSNSQLVLDTALSHVDFWDGVESIDGLSNIGTNDTGYGLENAGTLFHFQKAYFQLGYGRADNAMFGWNSSHTPSWGINTYIPKNMLQDISSINVDGINGSGTALSFGSTGHWDSLIPDAITSVTPTSCIWTVPGLVFRVTGDKMIITMLGRKADLFVPGALYTLSGCSQGTMNGDAFFLDESVEYMPFDTIASGFAAGALYEIPEAPAENWGDNAYITRLTFEQSSQQSDIISNWDTYVTYGEHNTVTFTIGSGPVNSIHVPGSAASPGEWLLHPRRTGNLSGGSNFSVIIKDNDDDDNRIGPYTTSSDDNDMNVTNSLLPLIQEARAAGGAWASEAKNTIGPGTIKVDDSGLTLKVAGDYSPTGPNAGYIKVGDLFTFDDTGDDFGGANTGDNIFRVKTISEYGADSDAGFTSIGIASATTDPWGGAAGSTGITHAIVKEGGACGTNESFSNVTVTFSSIRIIGNAPSATSVPLAAAGWVVLNLGVRDFDNGYSHRISAPINVRTRDIDFGSPNSKKALYGVIVTYKSSSLVNVKSSYNSGLGFTDLGTLSPSNSWTTKEITFSGSGAPVKQFSLMIEFECETAEFFEINDISIVYRAV